MKSERFPDEADVHRRGERLVPEDESDRAVLYAMLRLRLEGWRWPFVDEATHDGPRRLSIGFGADDPCHWDGRGCFRAYLNADLRDDDDNPVTRQMEQFQGVIWVWIEMRRMGGMGGRLEPRFHWSLGERIYPYRGDYPAIRPQSNYWSCPPVIHSSEIFPVAAEAAR